MGNCRRLRRTGLAVTAATAVMLLVPACGGGSGKKSTASQKTTSGATGRTVAPSTAAPGSTSATAGCGFLSRSTVEGVVGNPLNGPTAQSQAPAVVCRYEPVAPGGASVLVKVTKPVTASQFDTERQGFTASGQPTKDVSGVGDKAYSSSMGSGALKSVTVVALKGSTDVLVVVTSNKFDENTALAKDEVLIRDAFAQL